MSLITTSAELAQICERMAKHAYVTVDTEFLRETTFWPKLCVVQLATDDEAVAIDALADDIDLTPFLDLMKNTAVLKVFHAARQDIEIIWKLCGATPQPLFDTQVAATVCGYGDQVSYEQLATNLAAAKIDKSSRFTDWSRRPLTEAQITYALADVTHLRVVYQKLKARLDKTDRHEWLREEIAFLTNNDTYDQKPENAWIRLKNRVRKPKDLAILMEIAEWREREAQAKDVPRSRILKDDTVADVAQSAPTTVEALGRLRTIPQGYERSKTGQDLVACVQRGLDRDLSTLPLMGKERMHTNSSSAVVQLLKVLLQTISEKHHVASKMIATVDDLEAIALDDEADVGALQGWRHEMFGKAALELKAGKLALLIEDGKIICRPVSITPKTSV
jgi:ribonuclease D